MQDKPYFCPNCRSNRVKFGVITSAKTNVLKDAMTGSVVEMSDPAQVEEPEATIECLVCHFVGNELRFIKQAEREPRVDPMQQPNM